MVDKDNIIDLAHKALLFAEDEQMVRNYPITAKVHIDSLATMLIRIVDQIKSQQETKPCQR